MPPSALIESAVSPRHDSPAVAFTGMLGIPPVAPEDAATLALRCAQRAFAALFDHASRNHAIDPALRTAQLRTAAGRTLSALSADDRSRLVRWLALQIASANPAPNDQMLTRVDALLGSRVTALLPAAREELASRRGIDGIVAA